MPRTILLCAILFLVGCSSDKSSKLTIAVASNTQFMLEELCGGFTEKTGIECELIVSSSGKITAQIQQGADYDIFFSANQKYPDKLHELGLSKEKPLDYAEGKLVIWTTTEGVDPSFEAMTKENVKNVAIANPELAPYGLAAEKVIETSGYRKEILPKLIYGENIGQTNQYIRSGNAQIGITSLSSVMNDESSGIGKWKEITSTNYPRIVQSLIVLKSENEKKSEQSRKFIDFLFSGKGRRILEKHGYIPLEN